MSYNVGDIVNGHVLGSDNQWHPLAAAATTMTLERADAAVPTAKPKPFYRRWWFIGATGLAVIAIVASAAGGKGGSSTSGGSVEAVATQTSAAQAPAAAAAAPAETVAGLNTPVRDGDFEFTVTNLDCGKAQIGGQYVNKKAQGQFCLASMTVTNIGTDAQTFIGSEQKAVDGQGRLLEADSTAAIYLEDSKSLFEQINPGGTVKGVVVYDIPKTSTIVQLQLHDSMLSSGAKVNVA